MADARKIQHPITKKYIVVKAVDNPDNYKGSWKQGDIIRIVPSEFIPYIEGRFIVPFASQADRQIAKPTIIPAAKNPPKETPTPKTSAQLETAKTASADTSKKVITNTLSDAVQKKKAEIAAAAQKDETTQSEEAKKASLSAEKLAAIKAGGQK
jgi:hypothetical protein